MSYPGDQLQQIEDYLRAKGNDGPNVSAEAYKAALRIAVIASTQTEADETAPLAYECDDCGTVVARDDITWHEDTQLHLCPECEGELANE